MRNPSVGVWAIVQDSNEEYVNIMLSLLHFQQNLVQKPLNNDVVLNKKDIRPRQNMDFSAWKDKYTHISKKQKK